MPKNSRDQVWFITGASTGLGRELAKVLLGAGGRVVATARKPEQLKDLADASPGNLLALELDVTKPKQIDQAVAKAIEHFGRIDVLVNNAGYGVAGAIEEAAEDEFMPMFETNVFGLIRVTQAVVPHLRAQRSGAVINLSSIGGLIAGAGIGYYNATKFAVEAISGALYAELQPLGIHVMVVEPGPFRTDFLGRSGVVAKQRISDYDATAGKIREYFATQDGKQKGDPVRAAHAMIDAVNADKPPKHLLLGESALTRFRKHLEDWTDELNRWEKTTLGADYPDEAAPQSEAQDKVAQGTEQGAEASRS